MLLYALTIFLSAFLLFQVQPMIGKYILPWFGGTPAVWTTCQLFFQVALLAGYSYAHLVISKLKPQRQAVVHLIVLVAIAAVTLPIAPSEAWKPTGAVNPLWRILALLAATVGGPYLVLSTTGPLLQGWFARTNPGSSPYRLYALSNVGSLLALLSYPLFFERYLRLKPQTWQWSACYVVFTLFCAAVAWQVLKMAPKEDEPGREHPEAGPTEPPGVFDVFLWLGLAACGSTVFLATTNQLCQDVAVVPFLWVLPLSLYLLTFIICFDKEAWYVRPLFCLLLAAAISLTCGALVKGVSLKLWKQVAIYAGLVFCCCMVCHGEMVRLRPAPRYLTLFYLMVSVGGALGGIFVAMVAPMVYTGFWELHTGLIACCVLMVLVSLRDFLRRNNWPSYQRRDALDLPMSAAMSIMGLCGIIGVGYLLNWGIAKVREDTIDVRRNFYGVLRTTRVDSPSKPETNHITLYHGRIMHGYQYTDQVRRVWPTSYFAHASGIGAALDYHPDRGRVGRQFRFGVVGVGTATLAAYGKRGDYFRFYEINPQVIEVANRHFSYMRDAKARGTDLDVFLGDARIVMEQQLKNNQSQQFDVLAVDAFSSDAIPVHLLTYECFGLYWQQLKPDGILAVHISNRYLDLAPVVRKLAALYHKTALQIHASDDDDTGTNQSDWVLVTSNERFMKQPVVQKMVSEWGKDAREPLLWTDDYSSLYSVLE